MPPRSATTAALRRPHASCHRGPTPPLVSPRVLISFFLALSSPAQLEDSLADLTSLSCHRCWRAVRQRVAPALALGRPRSWPAWPSGRGRLRRSWALRVLPASWRPAPFWARPSWRGWLRPRPVPCGGALPGLWRVSLFLRHAAWASARLCRRASSWALTRSAAAAAASAAASFLASLRLAQPWRLRPGSVGGGRALRPRALRRSRSSRSRRSGASCASCWADQLGLLAGLLPRGAPALGSPATAWRRPGRARAAASAGLRAG